MFKLASLRIDAIDAIEQGFEDFDERAGRAEMIRAVDRLCLRFHVLAAAGLLVDGDPDKMFANLGRAAENWRRLHLHVRKLSMPPPPASKVMPLVGAIAASAWDIARGLAAVSDADWQQDAEYEEEFASARLWHALALSDPASPTSPGPVERALEDLESLGDDASADRIALGRALTARDARAFEAAVLAAADVNGASTEKRARAFSTPYTAFAPHRYLWFDGLAWLRLGERAGLRVKAEVPYCPALARLPSSRPVANDWVLEIGS